MWWRRSPSRWPRALAILSAPRTGRVFQPPFSGRFSLAAASRVTAYAGDGSLVHRVRCDADLQRLVVRRALLLAALRPGSRPRTSINASRPQSRRSSRSDPLQAASGAACVRRGHNVPTASPCLALQACACGVPGLEAPGIAARAGARPGASVWLLRVGWRMQPHEQHDPNVERTAQASGFWHRYDMLCLSSSREID